MFEYEVCIVGTGRVGLPLGLSLVDVGVNATGVDLEENLRPVSYTHLTLPTNCSV